MTTYQPSRWLEWLAERLIPPASVEHALGDIRECSASHAEYFRFLLAILPGVIWCQVRRRSKIGGVVFNAALSAYVLGFFQAFLNKPFLEEPVAWLRLAVPWTIWVAGCVLSAAYGPCDKPGYRNWKILGATVLAGIGAAALLGVPVVATVAGFGAIVALYAVLIAVFAMSWLKTGAIQQPVSAETLVDHARLFQRVIWWRNLRESLAGCVVLIVQVLDLRGQENPYHIAGNILIIAGVLFIICYLHFRAGSRHVPESTGSVEVLRFHRHEIARQRDILRTVPMWYLLPIVPGMVLGFAIKFDWPADLLALPIFAGVFALVWRLNLKGAELLDRQLHDLDAIDEGIH